MFRRARALISLTAAARGGRDFGGERRGPQGERRRSRGGSAALGGLALLGLVLGASPSPTTRPTRPGEGARWTEGPCGGLDKRLTTATTPLEECRACLLVARCLLVEQCVPRLSARCFDSTGADKALTQLSSEGLAMLDRAAEALGRVERESDTEVDSDAISDVEDRIEMLRTFGALFAAMGGDPTEETTRTRLLSAGNGLAVQLDDENPKVAASAKLWMAVAYRLAGRPDRALQLLRPVLSAPEAPGIGLTARLQHCLALGDRGDHVAALAVCSRIGARVEAWFSDEERVTRRRAAAEVRFTRVELLRGWARKLREFGQAERAAEAEGEADKLSGSESLPPPIERRLVLTESIAGLPNWDTEVHSAPTGTAPASAGREDG